MSRKIGLFPQFLVHNPFLLIPLELALKKEKEKERKEKENKHKVKVGLAGVGPSRNQIEEMVFVCLERPLVAMRKQDTCVKSPCSNAQNWLELVPWKFLITF